MSKMELDDRWYPDPLPKGNPGNQWQPRITDQSVHNSEAQNDYYDHGQISHPQKTASNLRLSIYDDVSDEDNSSYEYTDISYHSQVNQKRLREPDQAGPGRRKRHQSEHPSGIGRGRTTNKEDAMFDQGSIASQFRNKSVARGAARSTVPPDDLHHGYQINNSVPTSRKPNGQSQSRAIDSYQDHKYIATEDYRDFTGKVTRVASQNNDSTKRRIREEQFYNSAPRSINQGPQDSSRSDRELIVTLRARQPVDYSHTQSFVQRSSYDDGGNYHPSTENVISSARSQRQRQKPDLGSPLWPNHESSTPKPAPGYRVQGNIERSVPRFPVPITPRKQSVRNRTAVTNGTQSGKSKSGVYDYGSIDDDDINDTPLENDLRGKPISQIKDNNNPMDFMDALPKHSAFQSRKPQAAMQVYQTPPRNPHKPTTSGFTIDLVTPESGVSARGSIPFLPLNWTPRARGPRSTGSVKVSTPLKFSTKDDTIVSDPQQPEEDVRQRQAAEKIIRKELNAEREALQKDLFGEVVSETEEEKREREDAKRLEAQRMREEKERQLAIDTEVKQRKAEVRAQKEREKKEAEQREKEKEVAAKKAKRDAERHHQSVREDQAATKRRNAANKMLQEKKERDMALLKVIDEQKQIANKQKKENDAKLDEMKRSMVELQAQVKSQTIAALKPARKSIVDSNTKNAVDAPTTSTTFLNAVAAIVDGNYFSLPETGKAAAFTMPSTEMDLDDDDSLFLPETGKATDTVSSDQKLPNDLHARNESSDRNPTVSKSIDQGRVPSSIAEIFANTITIPSGGNFPEDKDVEREAIRKQRAEERMAIQRKRSRSLPAEPSPNPPSRKTGATSKVPSKVAPKNKSAQLLNKSPAKALFGTKLRPLHGPDDLLPCEEPQKTNTIAEIVIEEVQISKPRLLPLPLPPPLPIRENSNSNKQEVRLLSQTERDKIEAGRERIQAEAKARKDALTKQLADAKKYELEKKRTVEYRKKKKEKELRDQARKDGKEFGEFELETIMEKLMEKREREKKRRNQRRVNERVSSSAHEAVSNTNVPNALGITVPQGSFSQASSSLISSPATASDSNRMDEDDDPETQARKAHETRTADSLNALAQSRAARRAPVSPVERMAPLCSDDSSDESEEDPDDEEQTRAAMAHFEKIRAEKATENTDEAHSEIMTEEEIALERDLEAAFEEELIIEGNSGNAKAQLNPDDYGTQLVARTPDVDSQFQSSSTQRSSNTFASQWTQAGAPSQITQPTSTQPQKSASYEMVNVYMVMTQLTLHRYEDEAALKKKFLDIDKANKYAQTIVNEYRAKKYSQQEIVEKWDKEHRYSCQITHDNNKITKVYIKVVPMNPKEIDKYDPKEVHPRFANQYYTVRFERTTEQLDPENQEVRVIERTVGFADASKLYTVLEMANHAACEYFLRELKPKEEVEGYHNLYQEHITPQRGQAEMSASIRSHYSAARWRRMAALGQSLNH
ncbi:hypothetical protein DID88_002069 [Monilinia fructigena]|uniref:Uncharacterized protein n=1 Tax=Monilinia fructigena TaxID=38457 RepID=A0A395IVX9_9HELO|nr:hypothetical protein DID88_002069 [Monilinia fructigena]